MHVEQVSMTQFLQTEGQKNAFSGLVNAINGSEKI